MPRQTGTTKSASAKSAPLGYEAELWQMADALRGTMDSSDYKHVVLGLIFLKYISDAFEEQHAKLEADRAQGADPEDPDEYRSLSIFWGFCQNSGHDPTLSHNLGLRMRPPELNGNFRDR